MFVGVCDLAWVPQKAEPATRACVGSFIWGHEAKGWKTEKANKEGEKANPRGIQLVIAVGNRNSVMLRTW